MEEGRTNGMAPSSHPPIVKKKKGGGERDRERAVVCVEVVVIPSPVLLYSSKFWTVGLTMGCSGSKMCLNAPCAAPRVKASASPLGLD